MTWKIEQEIVLISPLYEWGNLSPTDCFALWYTVNFWGRIWTQIFLLQHSPLWIWQECTYLHGHENCIRSLFLTILIALDLSASVMGVRWFWMGISFIFREGEHFSPRIFFISFDYTGNHFKKHGLSKFHKNLSESLIFPCLFTFYISLKFLCQKYVQFYKTYKYKTESSMWVGRPLLLLCI